MTMSDSNFDHIHHWIWLYGSECDHIWPYLLMTTNKIIPDCEYAKQIVNIAGRWRHCCNLARHIASIWCTFASASRLSSSHFLNLQIENKWDQLFVNRRSRFKSKSTKFSPMWCSLLFVSRYENHYLKCMTIYELWVKIIEIHTRGC